MKVTVKVEVGEEAFEGSFSNPMITENFDIARKAFPNEDNLATIWMNLAVLGIGETVKLYGAQVARDVRAQLKEIMRG